ncbi:MAG: 1,4-dihydroxy-2-naphthoate polyprenyltransferase [Bacteroidales bacterium]|jgi:1,4-dihydroxy-2-naphthoate octaprenyltransferase|nr:1,4-dihydroxy-2-naphthoate polyprenyltransferase [Bacteroidales bacterium]
MTNMKNSFKAWMLAARPKTLPAAATPVLVACAAAVHYQHFCWQPALICFLFAMIAQIISNFANDYFDARKGSDNEERLGPQRAVSEGWIAPKTMLRVTIGLLIANCMLGLLLIPYGGWQLLGAGALIALAALCYSGGPYPLSYHGLGDIAVLIFFGIVPVGFTYYVQALQWSVPVVVCGIACGLVSINILVANNFRDRFSDRRAGKNTSIVLLGEKFGIYFYLLNGILAVTCCQYFWMEKTFLAAVLPMIYLLFHIKTWREMAVIGQGAQLNAILGKSARNELIFGSLLATGLLMS